ncbi:MAG: CDC48 family AAA ATPase [Candidatus Heimdallarchaeota archaeon]|nr:CDC48 family AAA ATPase [Candidatus Heimdallarchaeota archaeon]
MSDIRLKVDEARRGDVGRQIARISVDVATELGLKTGDVITIKGTRTTYAKIWRSSAPLIKPDMIKIEAIIRRNARVNLDEFVEISPVKVKIAKQVFLQPIQQITITANLSPFLMKTLIDRVITLGDIIPINTGFGGSIYLQVVKTSPAGALIFQENTKLTLVSEEFDEYENKEEFDESSKIDRTEVLKVSYEDLGGLDEPIRKIREMVELPLRHPEIFDRLGIQPPKGVLLYGPPGTGKTILARAIASETSSFFISIGGPEIMSKYYGEAESRLREIFESATKNAPSIIFIDEIDSIAPKRENAGGEVERRIVAQLLSLMDGMEDRGNVVVMGATNRPNSIDPALRRGGRFDRELEIGIPDTASRKEILGIHTRGMPLTDDVDLSDLANRTHGFVGADIETLAKEAALSALRRFLPELDLSKSKTFDLEKLQMLNIDQSDFDHALTEVSPSGLREVFIEVPDITWDEIGGLHKVKTTLQEAIEWPLRYEEVFKVMKAKAPAGVLLYGPPGTGKTMLAKAVASGAQANFISIKGPELISKWVGESEQAIREIFRKARLAAPCIIFFDEIDSIATIRSSAQSDVSQRVVSQLLTEIDGLEEMKGVTILAATNRPDVIDPALIRPGRFDKIIFIGEPDKEARIEIFKIQLAGMNIADNIDFEDLAIRSENYSGAEITAVVQAARMIAIREFISEVPSEDKIEESLLENLMLTKDHVIVAFEEEKPRAKRAYSFIPPSISDMRDINIA